MIHTARAKSKFKKLVRLLRNALPTSMPIDVETIATGILERLWHTTATDAFRGDIGRLSNDEIAESVGWFGDADMIVSMLIESRWIDPHDKCRLVVHDWAEHAPNWVKGNAKNHGGFIVPIEGSLEDTPKGRPLEEPTPNQTKPNQTKPSLTKPNQAAAAWAADAFGKLDYEDCNRLCAKLRKHKPPREDEETWKHYSWAVVVVGQAIRPGLAAEWVSAVTDGNVSKVRRYLEVAMENELKKLGYLLTEVLEIVNKAWPRKESVEA